jgi:hypothetical protein
MKSLVITYAAELGRALLDLQRQQFERDKQHGDYKPEETFDGIVLPNEKGIDVAAYDKVVRLKTESYKPSDLARVIAARNYAEAGRLVEARAELDLCDRPYAREWVETDMFVAALQGQGPTLSHDLRKMVERRADILKVLFDSHPGGREQLQLDKEPGTPGPSSLERFHRFVAERGLLPENDFGVRGPSLEYQPRGAHAHHVGWTRELREYPGRWLDVAWWVTLDVIELFASSENARQSAKERLANVPTGLRDWRAFQIEQAEGIDGLDATLKAMKEFGDR